MTLTTENGVGFDAIVVGPEDTGRAILIIHDWWGMLPYNREWADRFAKLGYRAMVVDLYDGELASDAQEAGEMMRGIDQEIADRKLLRAMEYLKDGGRKLAVLGWSFGGRQALQATLLDPESVDASVLYYCRLVDDEEALRPITGPILAVFAEQERTWPEKMEHFAAAMAAAGKTLRTRSYDAGHGFVNPSSERYDAAAAADAWRATEAFLQEALGKSSAAA
jgi:carboxymethylenebutenolidase